MRTNNHYCLLCQVGKLVFGNFFLTLPISYIFKQKCFILYWANKVICKVPWLGGEFGQFDLDRELNLKWAEFFTNEINRE